MIDNLLIKKFNEYLSGIHIYLNELALNPEHIYFTNQLLDRLEKINRQTFYLNHESDSQAVYSHKLEMINIITEENYKIVDEFIANNPSVSRTVAEMKHLFFMMNDLFYQSHALLESVMAA